MEHSESHIGLEFLVRRQALALFDEFNLEGCSFEHQAVAIRAEMWDAAVRALKPRT